MGVNELAPLTMFPDKALHETVTPEVRVDPDKVTVALLQFNSLSGPAFACTSEKLANEYGPVKSFNSELKDEDVRDLKSNAPNKFEQGPVTVAKSKPKSVKFIAILTICSGSSEEL